MIQFTALVLDFYFWEHLKNLVICISGGVQIPLDK